MFILTRKSKPSMFISTWMDTEEMRPIDVESVWFIQNAIYAYGFCRHCVQACCSGINLLTLCYLEVDQPSVKNCYNELQLHTLVFDLLSCVRVVCSGVWYVGLWCTLTILCMLWTFFMLDVDGTYISNIMWALIVFIYNRVGLLAPLHWSCKTPMIL